MTSSPPPSSHAIVIGGSIAGLTAARVLADHFERVTLIERDRMPETPEFRKGVPQGRHAHILLLRGQQILDHLFPGLVQELLDVGAVPVNMGSDVEWYAFGQPRPRYQSAMEPNACSRPLLEVTIYRRLAAHPNITFLQETDVLGLCTDEEGRRATGVQIRRRNANSEGTSESAETLLADLVVDASGRDSRAPHWLEALGYPTPSETTVNSFPGYATRFYEQSSEPSDWKLLFVQPHAPHQPRGAVIVPMEENRWQVTLIGMAGDYPPTDEEGYLQFAQSLPTQKVYDTIKEAKPLSDIYGFRRAENRLRHYDNLEQYLENFLVLGDAVYALNPVYGQGMSVAAIGSMTLDQCLREQPVAGDFAGLAERFQKALALVVEGPWQLATGEDRRWAVTEGSDQLDPGTLIMQRYMDQLQLVSLQSPAVTEAFYLVQQMIEPPTLFFRPDIVLQVFASMPQMEMA